MGNTCGLLAEPDVGSDRRKRGFVSSTARVSRIQKGGEHFFLGVLLKKQPDYRTCMHSNTGRVENCPLSINSSSFTVLVVRARNMYTVPQGTFPLSIYTDQDVEEFS